MQPRPIRLIAAAFSGFLLLLDQWLKYQALTVWREPLQITPYFGWQLYINEGIAFGLPLSNYVIIALTLPLIVLIAFACFKASSQPMATHIVLYLILAGALSNLIDRVTRSYVVDYFLLGTGIINLADISIGIGLLLYIYSYRKPVHQ